MKTQIKEDILKIIHDLNRKGYSSREISKLLNISKSCVNYNLKKIKDTGSFKRKTGSGKKSVLTDDEKGEVLKLIKKTPSLTATELSEKIKAKFNSAISQRMIIYFLKQEKYFNTKAIEKPKLSKKNINARLDFADKYIHFCQKEWDTVIFSDETKINLEYNDGIKKIWRRKMEGLKEENISKTTKFNGGSVMFWGCFSSSGVGKLVVINGIMDKFAYLKILKENLLPSVRMLNFNSFIFQQDNDPKHTSGLIKNYFNVKNINLLDWPSQSPDLNPIEHLWAYVKRLLGNKSYKKDELIQKVFEIWRNIPVELCRKLVYSMEKRLKAVIVNKGKHTKY